MNTDVLTLTHKPNTATQESLHLFNTDQKPNLGHPSAKTPLPGRGQVWDVHGSPPTVWTSEDREVRKEPICQSPTQGSESSPTTILRFLPARALLILFTAG